MLQVLSLKPLQLMMSVDTSTGVKLRIYTALQLVTLSAMEIHLLSPVSDIKHISQIVWYIVSNAVHHVTWLTYAAGRELQENDKTVEF